MKNALRRILHLIWIIPQKLSRKKDEEDDDQFYDAIEEPPDYYNIWNPPHRSDPTPRPPRPPLSDTDSLFGDDSGSDPFRQSILDRLPTSAQTSPMLKSPWESYEEQPQAGSTDNTSRLMTSLVREEGHIYSLAASGDLLYTGSSSKNIRVWKHHTEYSSFKSHSGLVKAIVISDNKIFTGHQDGKIRVWKVKRKKPMVYKKIGTLPDLRSVFKKSLRPKNYTEVKKNHSAIWIKHVDAISSLSLNDDCTLLYSGSWDKTIKVWRMSDFKCMESISAHDDVINAVVAGSHDYVFSGSADGTLKVWRKESQGKRLKHFFSRSLLKQEFAVTSLAVTPSGTVVYAGSSDGVVHYWEEEKLIHGGVLRGHKLAVLCLTLSGNMVFSGSADRSICVWQRDEFGRHRCLYVLVGHKGPVKCLAVEERQPEVKCGGGGGGKACTLYSGSLDKSVKIWRVCPQLLNNHQLPPPSPRRIDGALRGILKKSPHRGVCQQKK